MSEINGAGARLSAALGRIAAALATAGRAARTRESCPAEAEALEAEKRVLNQQFQAADRGAARKLEAAQGGGRPAAGRPGRARRADPAVPPGERAVAANNLALREANGDGLADAHLINKAMLTELESIRASRDADRAEIDAVLAELEPSDCAEAADA